MKYFIAFVLSVSLIVPLSANDVDDNSVIDELDTVNTQTLDLDFKMKTFESCDAFEDVMEGYMKTYWENTYKGKINHFRSFPGEPEVMEMSVEEQGISESVSPTSADVSSKSVSDGIGWGGWYDFSQTNIQVGWVDESDRVKTDGKYLYYYNEQERAVFILEAQGNATNIIKKIHLPENFYNIWLYVTSGRLVIVAGGYSQSHHAKGWYHLNRNSQTYTIVFDTTTINSPELIKLYSSDGDYSRSRRIGDYVYVISQNYFNYPYWNIKNVDDIVVDADKMLPQQLDISKTSNTNEQNLTVKNKNLPFKARRWDVTDCSSISYSFPDEETLKNTGFNPWYNIISAINITESENPVTTQVIAGNNSEIYMSQSNLYMTESIYQVNNFSCPPNALCAVPFFWGWSQNTLIHKLNIDKDSVVYQDSGLVPGSPLNQYSMDEHEGNFRIITSSWQPERSTGLYILDENLKKVSDLTHLAPGETFQSSRFLGDKLFLVTFEQIDPLFAIDLSDQNNPEVLGELKIPGFSTYLHPYDETHLMWLGYDTQINQWWGTQTAGVKLDLYKIHYDKKCWDTWLTSEQDKKCASWDYKWIIVEQLHTKTLWGRGSYSEALNNPRTFVWNANRNTLLLPATLHEKDDEWRTTEYYDGLFALRVDTISGINVMGQATHINLDGIEEARIQECQKYSGNTWEPVCRELWNGEINCENEREYKYIPNYCYKDSDVWQYIGDRAWEYRDMQMKRAVYIGENVYGFSDSQVWSYDWRLDQQSTTSFTK